MKWFVILYLPVLFTSVFLFLRAWYRYLNLKEDFRNMLPDCEKECVNVHANLLEILLKGRFRFRRSGAGPGIVHFQPDPRWCQGGVHEKLRAALLVP